jgi:stage II sporulation protein D
MGTRASVVNVTSMESYLRGVVPMEMPSTWPAEALKAQAIAARSYAAKRLHPTTGAYDLYDDTRSQVYGGINVEKATTYAAIAATAGVVVKTGSSVANTFFHSTGGGATEHNENAWVASDGDRVSAPISYLRGSPDVDANGKAYDAAAPFATWKSATLTPARLQTLLAADARTSVGTLRSIVVSVRGVSGRVVKLTITGSAGTKTVSGEVFRSIVNEGLPASAPIRSTAFYVTASG